jgi:hypothetical protein
MILGDPCNFGCDQCHAVAPGYTNRLPAGWSLTRWRPGVLHPPGGRRTVPDEHYCENCTAARKAAKEKDDAHPSEAAE